MCEMKSILVSVCLAFLVTESFCMYWLYSEKTVGQCSEIKIQNPRETENKKYCLNRGEGYYLIDQDIVGCNCTYTVLWRKTLWKRIVVDLGETLK